MKLQIDTTEKTLLLEEKVSLEELISELAALGLKDGQKYKLTFNSPNYYYYYPHINYTTR